MIKLCVFDFDSTLMDGETIDILAKAYDKEKEVVDITHRAMAAKTYIFYYLEKSRAFLREITFCFFFLIY